MNGIDITGQRFGYLTALDLIPREERTWSNKERAWRCRCDCGNETIVRQRNLLGARITQSCGCLRKQSAFLKTCLVPDLTIEYLRDFEDFEKFLFIHKNIRRIIRIEDLTFEEYNNYINYYYNDEQFNKVYNFWKSFDKLNTFYDLAKPSLDHIIPKSKGGNNSIENLHFITLFENLAKRDMTWNEWMDFKKKYNTYSDLFIEHILSVEEEKGGEA